ncbi:hypothetical protein GGI12_001210 [Dipsacomyces acuminosporus]|nr:hypothetical protein GGI12_001210 [Dipsacomyces acuminosporus]
MIPFLSLITRELELTPEENDALLDHQDDIISENTWKLDLAYGLSTGVSGLMVAFIICVFIWRRSLVNRTSLRIMFAMSLLDCIVSAIQIKPPAVDREDAACRAHEFFVDFGMFTSIYLSSSIAFNLYMVFLRKRQAPVPTYVECLYFIVPITVALLYHAPQYIWAGVNGYCSVMESFDVGTKEYMLYVFLGRLLPVYLFMLFNICTCAWVIVWLVKKQRLITATLQELRKQRLSLVSNSSRVEVTKAYERQLNVSRKVNSAALRIALYPLSPLAYCIMYTVYYGLESKITFDQKSDYTKMYKGNVISWFSYPAISFINFLVFLTDPVMLNVIKEVSKSMTTKFSEQHKFNEIKRQEEQDPNTESTLNESTDPGYAYGHGTDSLPPSLNLGPLENDMNSLNSRNTIYKSSIMTEL